MIAKLDHYRIESRLGEGGMGVVFLAFDTKLERRVAIKVLSADALSDPDRKRRFLREARAASALNHPNIITIHDIARCDDLDYIVMEYVEGRTLDEHIAGHGLPISKVLQYGVQIADALARAHAAGIIHRDIKPENIMVSDDGRVKVLDFGLAKLMDPAAAPVGSGLFDASYNPEAEGTILGSVLGTAEYMSPEQADGKAADARSDIFSTGAVLYEMVTGRRAFGGATKYDAMQAVCNKNPAPPSSIVPATPAALQRAILRCLEKNPDKRFQQMEDLRQDLARQMSKAGQSTSRYWLIGGVAAVLMVLAAGFAIWATQAWRVSHRPRTNIIPVTSYPGQEIEPAISPDGQSVAFIWDGDDGKSRHLYVKRVDSGDPLRLSNSELRETLPVWSPDGMRIAFLRQVGPGGKMDVIVVPAAGGTEQRLGESGWGLDWSPDGSTLVIVDRQPDSHGGLSLLEVAAGGIQPLLPWHPGVLPLRAPRFSPDGRSIAFAAGEKLYVVSAKGGPAREVLTEKHAIEGLDWTADGKELVYSWTSQEAQPSMYRIALSGAGVPEAILGQAYHPAVARDANRLAYEERVFNENLWRIENPCVSHGPDAARPKKLISSSQTNDDVTYSPDGTKLVFTSSRSGNGEIWIADSAGRHSIQVTNLTGAGGGSASWSPDGRAVVFDSRSNVYKVSSSGGPAQALTTQPFNLMPGWTKDGRWIYFTSNRSGTFQLWRVPAAGGTEEQLTKDGAMEAKESLDGRSFFYAKPGPSDARLWTIPVNGGTETPVDGLPDRIGRRLWVLSNDGIFFIREDDTVIRFFDFKSRKITPVYSLEKSPIIGHRNLAVSPDGRWITWAQVDVDNKDIGVIDHFR